MNSLDFNCGIYTITSPSGKKYIGSAVKFSRRWREHKSLLRRGAHHCLPLQRAFDKYGESALTFAKIAFVPKQDLLRREQEQLDAYLPHERYNVLPEAGSMLGMRHSEAAKAKMSAARKGRLLTGEHAAKIAAALAGKPKSAQHRERLAIAGKARVVSSETRAKLAQSSTGRIFSEESRAKKAATLFGKKRASNKSGFVGVSVYGERWMASATVNRRRHYLGYFDTAEAAHEARETFLRALIVADDQTL